MRTWLIAIGGLILLNQAGCRGGEVSGQRLRILSRDWPQAQAERRFAKEVFSPRTGIAVDFEYIPAIAGGEDLLRRLKDSAEGYDIVCYDGQWLARLVSAGVLARLDSPPFLQEAKCPIKFEDFIPSVSYAVGKHPVSAHRIFEGNYAPYRDAAVYGLPWAVNVRVLAWRRDHCEQSGLAAPPQTWDEFLGAARKLNVPPARFGAAIAAACRGDSLLAGFLPIMWSFGGELWKADDCRVEGLLNGAANVAALELFSGWTRPRRIVSPDCTTWTEEELLAALARGRASMGLLWSALGDCLEDPAKSKAAGKLGYGRMPGRLEPRTGKIKRVTVSDCQGIGILSSCERKDAAWTYLKWLFSTSTQQAMTDAPYSGFISARHELSPYTASRNERARAALDSLAVARDFPHEEAILNLLPAIQKRIHSALAGRADCRETLDAAAKEAQAALGPDCP